MGIIMKDFIPKEDLVIGVWYKGDCRNATVAFWDGTRFTYFRNKFGNWFPETICHPEDDDGYDFFLPEKAIMDYNGEILT